MTTLTAILAFLLGGAVPASAVDEQVTVDASPNIDWRQFDYAAGWQQYFAKSLLSSTRHTMAELPEAYAADSLTTMACDEIVTDLEQALSDHPVAFTFHYMAMSCAQLRGDSQVAADHEFALGELARLMTKDRDGSSESPWHMGLFTDAELFLSMAGFQTIDSFFSVLTNDEVHLVVLALDEANGKMRRKHFDAAPFINGWRADLVLEAQSKFGAPEASYQEHMPWLSLSEELATHTPKAWLTTIGYILLAQGNEDAHEILASAAELGSPIAGTRLAREILDNRVEGTESDALNLIMHAADLDFPEAILWLALMHELGLGVPPDTATAMSLVESAAKKLEPFEAETQYALLLFGKIEFAEFITRTRPRLQHAVAAENATALAISALMSTGDEDHEAAIQILNRLEPGTTLRASIAKWIWGNRDMWRDQAQPIVESEIAHGNPELAFWLADQLRLRDDPQTRKFMTIAAEAYEENATYLLARDYEYGLTGPVNLEQAVFWYRRGAEDDHTYCQTKLAYHLMHDGQLANFAEGQDWLEKAASMENPFALVNLYRFRVGEPQWNGDYNGAIEHFKQLDDEGNPFSWYVLGILNARGFVDDADLKRAVKLLKKARRKKVKAASEALAEVKSLSNWHVGRTTGIRFQTVSRHLIDDLKDRSRYIEEAMEFGSLSAKAEHGRRLANGLSDKARWQEGVELMREAANGGIKSIRYWLGRSLLESAPDEGIRWLQAAADDDDQAAIHLLGASYRDGEVVARDLERAAHYFVQAIIGGRERLINDIALLFETDDYERALFWYGRAAIQGDAKAARQLGRTYLYGLNGIEKDHETALYYLSIGADGYDRASMYHLARCFEEGYGVEIDLVTARAWYQNAANRGEYRAKARLGWMMAAGLGGEQDERAGRKLVEDSMDKDHGYAFVVMGRMYEQGLGRRKSARKAVEYYGRAVALDSNDGRIELARVLTAGQGVDPDLAQAQRLLELAKETGSSRATAITACLELGEGDCFSL